MEILYVIYRINTGNVNATQENKETIERKATCRLHRTSPKDPVMEESCHCQRQGSDVAIKMRRYFMRCLPSVKTFLYIFKFS